MENNKLPIETTTVPVKDVAAAIDSDCDVELDGEIHIAAIVGITPLKDGKYTIVVRHDTAQGEDGGTMDQPVTYDPKTNKISGGEWLDGRVVDHFVVECYKKP